MPALLSRDNPSLTPREVVEVPERLCWEDEVPYRKGEEIDEQPAQIGDLARRDDDQETG